MPTASPLFSRVLLVLSPLIIWHTCDTIAGAAAAAITTSTAGTQQVNIRALSIALICGLPVCCIALLALIIVRHRLGGANDTHSPADPQTSSADSLVESGKATPRTSLSTVDLVCSSKSDDVQSDNTTTSATAPLGSPHPSSSSQYAHEGETVFLSSNTTARLEAPPADASLSYIACGSQALFPEVAETVSFSSYTTALVADSSYPVDASWGADNISSSDPTRLEAPAGASPSYIGCASPAPVPEVFETASLSSYATAPGADAVDASGRVGNTSQLMLLAAETIVSENIHVPEVAGTTDTSHRLVHDIAEMSPDFVRVASQALRCSLSDVPCTENVAQPSLAVLSAETSSLSSYTTAPGSDGPSLADDSDATWQVNNTSQSLLEPSLLSNTSALLQAACIGSASQPSLGQVTERTSLSSYITALESNSTLLQDGSTSQSSNISQFGPSSSSSNPSETAYIGHTTFFALVEVDTTSLPPDSAMASPRSSLSLLDIAGANDASHQAPAEVSDAAVRSSDAATLDAPDLFQSEDLRRASQQTLVDNSWSSSDTLVPIRPH